MRFKRNQVEEAISSLREPDVRTPSLELRTKVKRLLETDRKLGRSSRSADPERAQYAFYSAEARGSGVEVWFSAYEAFALFMALLLLEHGWPQAGAVSIVRRARPVLESRHTEILKRDHAEAFDAEETSKSRLPGLLAVSTANPVFLAIASRRSRRDERDSKGAHEVKVLEEDELMRFCRSEVGLSVTCFELVRTAHKLRRMLTMTSPSKRGPGSG